MIKPTVGRVVWYTPDLGEEIDRELVIDSQEPLAAIVTCVWGDRLVNLAVFAHNGTGSVGRKFVTLLQDDDAKPRKGRFASWMPYQKGQAAKTEQLEQASKPVALLYTTRHYPCGCRAEGTGDVPAYCSEHDKQRP